MQKKVGCVVDRSGGEVEVWLDGDGHVALYENDAQVSSFWLGQPCQGDPLQVAAQRVAAGEAKRIAVFDSIEDDDDPVLIEDDTGAPPDPFKTLRRWPGDGKVH